MCNPYKLKLGEYLYCKGVEYYVMTINGVAICDTYDEAMDLVAEAESYVKIAEGDYGPTPQS